MARTGRKTAGTKTSSPSSKSSSSSSKSSSSSSKSSSSSSPSRKSSPKPSRSTPTRKSSPKPSPKPSPRSVPTKNTQPPSQNTGRVNPRSPVTNNPQVKTQNNVTPRSTPTPTGMPTPRRTPIDSDRRPPRPPTIRLPTIRLPPKLPTPIKIRFVDNPNTINPAITPINPSGDASYFTGYPDPYSTFKPSIQKEFAEHEAGTTLIDKQRLQAIAEGRIVLTEGIETKFTPSPQQLKVLQAMEAQKLREKTLTTDQQNQFYLDQKPNKMTMTFKGQDVTEKSMKTIEQQRKTREEQKQLQLDYQNRTDQDRLNDFIKIKLAEEKYNPQSPSDTNLTAYLAERGFDVNDPKSIPSEVITVGFGKLDTADKMLQAGVSPNIVNIRLESMGKIDNPNNTITNVMTNTTVQPIQSVNWTGLSSTPTLESTAVLNLATLRQDDTILFTPPEAENTNKPVGRDIQTVTTTGIEGTQPITKDSKTGAGLALLAGMVLLGV